MRKLFFASFSTILMVLSAYAAVKTDKPDTAPLLETVSLVDLKRYSGMWYEIARYPNKFEKNCAGDVTATYSLKDDGKVKVLNKCLKKDGSAYTAEGEARIKDKASNSKLEVRFAPGILSFLPQVWGDYWIIDLAPDYSYSVIGDPKREYFWILSRSPQMDEVIYQNILRRAEQKGFKPGMVMKTSQKVETIKGNVIEKQ